MKTFITALLIVILFVATGGLAYYGQQQLSQTSTLISASNSQLGQVQNQVGKLKEDNYALVQQISELKQQLAKDEMALSATRDAQSKMLASVPRAPATPAPADTNVAPVYHGPAPEILAARHAEEGMTYNFMILKDGTVFRDVTVTHVDPDGITLSDASKVETTVKFDKLPNELVTKLGFSQQESDLFHGQGASGDPGSSGSQQILLAQNTGKVTPFGVVSTSPTDSSASESIDKSVQSQLLDQVNALKAQAKALRKDATNADTPADAQAKLDQAAKLDQQATTLQAAVGS